MAEFVTVATQEVAQNGNVVFTNTAVKPGNCIKHREGSGIITLRGLTNQCRARYFVNFSANIAVPAGCCVNIAVKNTSTQAIDVANANIVVTREA